MEQKKVWVIMGISGSGKSTIGQALAKKASFPFLDADDFHPKENVMKMSSGIPLDDDDRWPWLAAIVEFIKHAHRDHFILACSALKASYRDFLSQGLKCEFILLDLSKEEAIERMQKRTGHFMKSGLVDSQLDTLQITDDLKIVEATLSLEELTDAILQKLK